MFTEVSKAILPIALRRLKRRGDLERAALLVESFDRHWKGSKPFELLIVAPGRDVAELGKELPRFPRVDVSVRAESEFFSRLSAFYLMPGWYRQQLIKLMVPTQLGFAGFLTLDSDVVCVGDFDEATFVRRGRALSRWEPKYWHGWWENAANYVGTAYDAGAHGLSVTPNILHGDLTRQVLEHLAEGGSDPARVLALTVMRKMTNVTWTEYSLYTCVAEKRGNLLDYHVHWDECYRDKVHLFSERSCVWGAEEFERMSVSPGGDPGGKFIIVQSHARIPIQRVRDYCLAFAG